MIEEQLARFPLSPDLVMLNHASFGVMTADTMALASSVRVELERDSLALVDVEALVPRLRTASDAGARVLGLDPVATTLTQNATAGAAAVMRSLPLGRGETVVVLSTEYASVLRGWQVRCDEVGARAVRVEVPLPLRSSDELLEVLEAAVPGDVAIVQLSLVSSSTAVLLPVAEVAAWGRSRGAVVVLDAAHGPGHVAVQPDAWGVDAMFATMHKWFPTPRPVGLLWLAASLLDLVRPAEVSLTWDSSDLVERFAWPGTFDPTPRLCLPAAIETWVAWETAGDLVRCAALARYASSRLAAVGGMATATEPFLPPRLRAVVLPAHDRAVLLAAMAAEGLRGWTGVGPSGETMLRVATHVYNDESDVDRLCDVVAATT